MRIATDYEIDFSTGKIIRPGEIIFDEVNICKQDDNINKQINLNENDVITEPENIEQETEDNIVAKNKRSRKSVFPEIN